MGLIAGHPEAAELKEKDYSALLAMIKGTMSLGQEGWTCQHVADPPGKQCRVVPSADTGRPLSGLLCFCAGLTRHMSLVHCILNASHNKLQSV